MLLQVIVMVTLFGNWKKVVKTLSNEYQRHKVCGRDNLVVLDNTVYTNNTKMG